MDADGVREEWEKDEIKEEILSEDENLDDYATIDEQNEDENEVDQDMFSLDGCCYFIKEEKHDPDFKEETEDESDQQNYLNFVSVKGEPVENEVLLTEDATISSELLKEESDNEVKNLQNRQRKKWRGRFRAYSLFHSKETQNTASESEVPKTSTFTESANGMGEISSSVDRQSNDALSSETCSGKPKSKEKPFECGICGQKFTRKRNLANHILMHIGETRFRCDICHIGFVKRNTFSEHMRIHGLAKIRSYKCDKCDAAFAEKTTLYMHARVHSRERPFVCDICDMSFKMKSVLKNHMLVHLDSESKFTASFDCKFCSQSFPRKNQLQKHVRDHAYQQYKFALYPNSRP